MFEKLVNNLSDLLESKIDSAGSMWKKEQFQEARERVATARTFEEIAAALQPVKFDRGVSLRLTDLERCAAERVWLSSECSTDFLRDVYAQCAEDLRATKTVAQMVSEVSRALKSCPPGSNEPDMRRWHANQRRLWEIERQC